MNMLDRPLNRRMSLIVSLNLVCLVFSLTATAKVQCYETYDSTDQLAEESSLDTLSHYNHSAQDLNVTFDQNKAEYNAALLGSANNPTTVVASDNSSTTPYYNIKQISQPKKVDADPLHAILPKIKFSCKNRNEGYYADYDFCDIFHYCKATGYRFTFLCPNNSFYNKELMACEHNVTQLENCKSKTKSQSLANEVSDIVANATNKQNLFDQLKTDIADIGQSMTATTDHMSTSSTTPTESMHTTTDKKQSKDNQTNEPPLEDLGIPDTIKTKYNRKLSFENVNNQLSTTTLIPPSLYVELPNNDVKSEDNLPHNGKFTKPSHSYIKYGSRWPSISTTTELPDIQLALRAPFSATTTTSTTTSTPIVTTTIRPSFTVTKNHFLKQETEFAFPYISNQFRNSDIQHADNSLDKFYRNRNLGKSSSSSNDNDDGGNLANLFHYYANIANQSTTNKKLHNATLERTYANKWNNFNSRDIDNILKTLDMSNYDLKEKYQKPYLNAHSTSNSRFNTNSNYGPFDDKIKETFPQKKPPLENNKFLISIPRFLREGLPAQYLKNVPKLFKNFNAFKGDYDTSESELKPVIMPKKSDGGQNMFRHEEIRSSIDNISMLSIPVLVPISLSQDDYRQRISTSVLKPIVIPLKEKGKLIPAYVLQFSGKHRGRYKRDAQIGKRKLLKKLVKPNRFYNMLPSIIKNIQPKPVPVPVAPKPAFDLLMSPQKTLPMYSIPTIFPNGAATKMVNYNNPYDLTDYRNFIPPFYFVDPQMYLQYRPALYKKSMVYKRPPLRPTIPTTGMNGTALKFYPKVATPTDLLAVDSEHNNQKLNKPHDFNSRQLHKNSNANANKLPANYENNRLTSSLGKAYYSPLLYFGNPVIGSDLVRFKPLIKDKNFFKKGKVSKALLNANTIKNETKQLETQLVNTTAPMPANIYVPDDFLDEYQVDLNSNDLHNGNNTSVKSESVDNTARKEFVDQPHNLQIDESNTIQVFTKFNRPSYNQPTMKPANNQINNRVNNKMLIDHSQVIYSREIAPDTRTQSDHNNKNAFHTSLLKDDQERSNKYSQAISEPIEERSSKQADHSHLASYLEHLKFGQTS